jgi:2-amino-4-hydroxy-6-hydroxymethyldihydropteridine diphosphokinase
MPRVPAVVGLGGNLGDAAATLRAALPALDALPDTRLVRSSRLFRTRPWGRRDQPDFVNAAALLETTLPPRALLEGLLAVERAFGRDREADTGRWGPRTLDLDLLLYGDRVVDEPGLVVPHPHLHERVFALLPLVEAWPEAAIPGIGPARAVLAAMACEGIEALS